MKLSPSLTITIFLSLLTASSVCSASENEQCRTLEPYEHAVSGEINHPTFICVRASPNLPHEINFTTNSAKRSDKKLSVTATLDSHSGKPVKEFKFNAENNAYALEIKNYSMPAGTYRVNMYYSDSVHNMTNVSFDEVIVY